jgi:hypothetical protein
MFLSAIKRLHRDDAGAALMAVLALTLITTVIAVTVGTVTVNALQTTNGNAGAVEARAAADAGVVTAELALRVEGACEAVGGIFTADTAPAFAVETFHDNDNGTEWVPGCPPAAATQVRFVSTGFADRPIFGAAALGAERVVEAVYQYIPQYTDLPVIDPAVYAHRITGTLKNFTLGIEPNTVIASDIQIRSGNFICTNGASVAGSVVLGDGRADLTNCRVGGNLYVSDYVRAAGSASTITGNVIAAGRVLDAGSKAVDLSSDAKVSGDVFAGGSVVLKASPAGTQVGGKVTAARNSSTIVSIVNGTRIVGNTLTTGTTSGNFAPKPSTGVVGLQPPPAPVVPDWTDLPFTSSPAAIQASTWWTRGFRNVVTWTGSCNLSGSDGRWGALSSYTQKTIIDATACVGGVVVSSNLSPDVPLQTDVVFFSSSFSFTKLPAQALNLTDARRLYFIVPDNTSDKLPTCSNGAGNITYNNETNINAPLALFFYSPCSVISDRNNMRGQIYGGSVEFRQQARWTYVPSSPPGINFDTGGAVQQALSGAVLGQRLSIRELSSGG